MPKFDQLTKREREVFALIAEGATNPQIARALRLSHKTVQNYVSRILDKLQIANRTQAARQRLIGLVRRRAGLPMMSVPSGMFSRVGVAV